LAIVCASLSVKPSSNTSAAQTKTEARGTPIYGVVRVAAPNGMKALPAELVPLP
jgi:hypothetical protein